MRCRTCDYPLWNLRSRSCPECGTPFAPSRHVFTPNSVRFCCPHCGQDYYGTGRDGHLVPEAFTCVRCAKPITMDEMVLLPTEGVAEERTTTDVVPWFDRARRGYLKGWLGTVTGAMFSPGRLARAAAETHQVRDAFWFSLLTNLLYCAFGGLFLLFPLIVAGGRWMGGMLVMLLLVALGLPLVVGALVLLWALTSHAILRLSGKTSRGVSGSLSSLCLTSGANLLLGVPCIGIYMLPLSWIWWAIAAVPMLALTHGVSKARAAWATILPPLFTTIVLGVAVAWFVIPPFRTAMAAAGSSMSTVRAMGAMKRITFGLGAYARDHAGASPGHGTSLLAEKHITIPDLFLAGAPANPADAVIAGIDTTTVSLMSPEERAAAIQTIVQSLPANTIAHRFGDVVFVYHGIDLSAASKADPNLWLVVCDPTPSPPSSPPPTSVAPGGPTAANPPSPPPSQPSPNILVGTRWGGSIPIARNTWASALSGQNALRAKAGLPPLPDVLTIKQAAPAVAPAAAPPPSPEPPPAAIPPGEK